MLYSASLRRAERKKTGCTASDCDSRTMEITDVFCVTHDQFVPFGRLPGVIRGFLLITWAAATCLAFPLGVIYQSPLPVFAVSAVAGGAILILPLRLLWPERTIWAICWVLLVSVLFASDPTNPMPAFHEVGSLVAAVTVVVWVVRFDLAVRDVLLADVEWSSTRWRSGAPGLLAFLVGVVLLLASLALPIPVAYDQLAPLGDLRDVWLTAATWATGAGLFAIAGVAAIDGFRALKRPFLRKPERPWRISSPSRLVASGGTLYRDPFSRMGRVLARGMARTALMLARLAVRLLNAMIRTVYLLTVAVVGLVNWLVGWLVSCYSLVRDTLIICFRAAWIATKLILIPTAGVVGGAASLAWFTEAAIGYSELSQAHLIGRMLLFATTGWCSLTVSWLAVCRIPLRRAISSAWRSGSLELAIVIAVVFSGGWLVGSWGLWGHGPIRSGILTFVATGLLLCFTLPYLVKERLRLRRPADLPMAEVAVSVMAVPDMPDSHRSVVEDQNATVILPLAGVSWSSRKKSPSQSADNAESVE